MQLVRNSPKVTDPRVAQLLEPDESAMYKNTTKPAKLCGSMLAALVSSAGFNVEQEVHINTLLGQVAGNVGMVARIKLQALPYGKQWCLGLMCGLDVWQRCASVDVGFAVKRKLSIPIAHGCQACFSVATTCVQCTASCSY